MMSVIERARCGVDGNFLYSIFNVFVNLRLL